MSDKIKTLSQAIRLGATFRPQCKLAFFKDGASCALGAALEALGFASEFANDGATVWLWRRFNIKLNDLNNVARLNDAGWTREAIASWLEAQGL